VALYLFGSLATGDFEAGVSDLDLLAVLAGGPDNRLVPPIPWGEFAEAVRRSLAGLADRVPDDASPGRQRDRGREDGSATVCETRSFMAEVARMALG
jgi:predicted nucleotidyltransferase